MMMMLVVDSRWSAGSSVGSGPLMSARSRSKPLRAAQSCSCHFNFTTVLSLTIDVSVSATRFRPDAVETRKPSLLKIATPSWLHNNDNGKNINYNNQKNNNNKKTAATTKRNIYNVIMAKWLSWLDQDQNVKSAQWILFFPSVTRTTLLITLAIFPFSRRNLLTSLFYWTVFVPRCRFTLAQHFVRFPSAICTECIMRHNILLIWKC